MNGPRVIAAAAGVVAVWKPAGLATQAPAGIASVEAWLRRRLDGGPAAPGRPVGYLGVPHRLDRAVSGVVLFAATPRAARQLSRQFERRQVRKCYLGIVVGNAAGAAASVALLAAAGREGDATGEVTWCDALEKIPGEPRARIVAAGAAGGREAVTVVRLLSSLPGDRLLLALRPLTGRMHQLRLQAAARGLPIVGDDLYGVADAGWSDRVAATRAEPADDGVAGTGADGDPDAARRAVAVALHAARIEYLDPDAGTPAAIDAELPEYWPDEVRDITAAGSSPCG